MPLPRHSASRLFAPSGSDGERAHLFEQVARAERLGQRAVGVNSAVLTKPVDLDELEHTLTLHLSSRRA